MSPLTVHMANATLVKPRRPRIAEWLAGIAIFALAFGYLVAF